LPFQRSALLELLPVLTLVRLEEATLDSLPIASPTLSNSAQELIGGHSWNDRAAGRQSL